ncbi:MAG: hypothetical protein V1747_05405 [Candidatus Omnitrophota bacterium]
MKKRLGIISLICGIALIACFAQAAEQYNPPFQLSGIVKDVGKSNLNVYLPHINKEVLVTVLPKAVITNRMDKTNKSYTLESIRIDDLVVVNGVLQNDLFLSQEISYLPTNK